MDAGLCPCADFGSVFRYLLLALLCSRSCRGYRFLIFGIPLWAQVLVFVIFSCLCVFCVRPLVVKYLHTDRRNRRSNADALLGREGVVIEPITAEKPGYVKIDGDEWRAVSKDGSNIDKGTIVKVVARESIVVTVEVAVKED